MVFGDCFLVVRHPANLAMAQRICFSIGGTLKPFAVADTGICGGGIVWLQESLPAAQQYVLTLATDYSYRTIYGLLAPCLSRQSYSKWAYLENKLG